MSFTLPQGFTSAKKSTGKVVSVDYRALNEITIKDKLPLPRIDYQIDQLGRVKFFTTLFMAAGFYVASRRKFSWTFVIPDGHNQYLRVPCGLLNAPAVF